MNNEPLIRILFIEDLPSDTELAEWGLREEGLHFSSIRVDTEGMFLKALEEFRPDLIISDYSMPEFDGLRALRISLKHDPFLPFIILTGSMNEETAVDCMKVGATDYVIKEHIKKLPFAVKEALEQKKVRLAKGEAERERREHQEELEAIYLNSPLMMILLNQERKVRKINRFVTESIGSQPEKLIGRRIGEILRCLHALDDPEGCGFGPSCGQCILRRTVMDTFQTGQSHQYQDVDLTISVEGEETVLAYLLSTTRLILRKQPMVLVSIMDITERKRAEELLHESEGLYRSLFENMLNGFAYCRMLFENERPQDFIYLAVNEAFESQTGLRDVVGKKVTELIPGIRESDPQLFEIYGRVARTGRPERFEVFVDALQMWLWISVYSPTQEHFVTVFDVITERKNAEERLKQTLENLRKAIGGIIQVISATVESRDPYTAGHQRRTADLARAIATEMKLAEDLRDGLFMAGTIHDLGKVSIPAEILSKPSRLTEIEYQMVQTHPQTGYDILKGIEFPWPVAEVVLQHHERMNGSGYPQGLKGEKISTEAQILMVADVVEAMASYRPYRPSLGVEAALEEIEKNKGVLYDSRVVEVCLNLFREKGFGFE